GHALVRKPHDLIPDVDRQAAAGELPGRGAVVGAEPDAGDEMSGVADEPGVAEILARAGLAGGWPARNLCALRGADTQRLAHHRIHHRDVLRLDDLSEILARALVEDLA